KFNAQGTGLVFSGLHGGSGSDRGRGIALDPSGNIYVTGDSTSTDLPTTSGGLQTTAGGGQDGFVLKLPPAGTRRTYASYLGGGGRRGQRQRGPADRGGLRDRLDHVHQFCHHDRCISDEPLGHAEQLRDETGGQWRLSSVLDLPGQGQRGRPCHRPQRRRSGY